MLVHVGLSQKVKRQKVLVISSYLTRRNITPSETKDFHINCFLRNEDAATTKDTLLPSFLLFFTVFFNVINLVTLKF